MSRLYLVSAPYFAARDERSQRTCPCRHRTFGGARGCERIGAFDTVIRVETVNGVERLRAFSRLAPPRASAP